MRPSPPFDAAAADDRERAARPGSARSASRATARAGPLHQLGALSG